MKKSKHRYSITLSDDSRLRRVARIGLPLWQWLLCVAVFCSLCVLVAALLLSFTPLRSVMPGYIKEETRHLTVENMMRLDSLQLAYDKDRAYIDNIITIFNTDRQPTDSSSLAVNPRPLTADSVMARTPEEERFIRMMEQREKYNLSILAPLAAEGMIFNPLTDEGGITAASRKKTMAELTVASDSPLGAIADGVVVEAYSSPADGGGVVIVQHGKGFVSRVGRLGSLLVSRGDYVQAGQIIAFPQTGKGRDGTRVTLEIWRNGDALVPYEVIGHN